LGSLKHTQTNIPYEDMRQYEIDCFMIDKIMNEAFFQEEFSLRFVGWKGYDISGRKIITRLKFF